LEPLPRRFPNPPAAGTATEPAGVHPAWDQALANIPEAWQKPIRDQIAAQERESQRALEQARGASVPESWKGLFEEAQQAQLSPEDLVNAYNGQQQLYAAMMSDPDQFLADIHEQIDQAVAAGQITRKAGAQAKANATAQVTDAVNDADELLTPEQQQLRDLQAWKDQQEQAAQSYQEQQAAFQQQQIADNEAQTFIDTVHNAFDSDPALAGANAATRQIAAQVASGLIDSDPTGRLTYDQAIGAALNQLREQLGWQGAPVPAENVQPQVPNLAAAIGGGTQGVPTQGAAQFDLKTQDGRDARDAALVAAIEQMNAQGATR
jgi:hypothetical protein